MLSEPLFVTYPARAGGIVMVIPGVVGPAAVPDLPASPFFVHEEQPPIDVASAAAARARYKKDVKLVRALAVVCSAATLALVCTTGTARANGRFPQAQAILTVPGGDGATIFLRATFGILVSRDGGKSWHWICERALGYDGIWDPPIAVTRDGRLWVGLEHGLASSADGCTFEPTPELDGEQVVDITSDVKGETLWVVTGSPTKRASIWRRSLKTDGKTDGGAIWERLGQMPEDIHPMTIEVAPSKPSRIYVTAQPYGTIRGWLWKSDDGGKTFTGEKNTLVHEGPLFIASVDPKDPNRVVMRHLHTTGSTVLVTPDGGKTFKETLSMDSAMFGFAKSADGATLWAGSGLPVDGIFRSTDRGEHFERVSNHGVLCLHAASAEHLWVCENPFALGGPAVGISRDQGKSVTAITKFTDIVGPLACGEHGAAADSGGNVCAGSWAATSAQFVAPDAGAAKRRDAGADVTPGPTARGSTCGCAVIGASNDGARGGADHLWLTAGLLPLAVWARARRRPGSRQNQSGRRRTSGGRKCAL